MVSESNQILKLTYQDLCTIRHALTVYRMYLYEDFDKEDNSFLKDKHCGTINDAERVMKALLKLDCTIMTLRVIKC